MQATSQVSANFFGPTEPAVPMSRKEQPVSTTNTYPHRQPHPDDSRHRSGRGSHQPSRASSTPEQQAGPMRQHRPSPLTPTPQPVWTIGMWRICLTVPLTPI